MISLKFLISSTAIVLAMNSVSQAQTSFDFSRYTCEQLLGAPLGERVINTAWYSGYYNGTRKNTKVDMTKFEQNVNAVVQYCESNPKKTVMQAVEKSGKK